MSKSVLITGTSRGLGKELVSVFRENGWNVVEHRGWKDGDLKQSDTLIKLRDLAIQNNIDMLINNAGIYRNSFLDKMALPDFKEVIETNLLAPVNLTALIWPIFQNKRSGTVVFINSVAGKTGSPGELAYCTSKFGLKGFADSLQYDGIKANVKVLSVYLGAMWTDMCRKRGGRKAQYIDPHDAALMIFDACKQYPGGEQTEIVIDRVSQKGKR